MSDGQDLARFRLPPGFRGRGAIMVQLWWIVEGTAFRWSPQVLYFWRVWLLRLFGARIGKRCIVRPSVRTTYPWKVCLGDHVWIGDDVVLYSLGSITVGSNSVISQRTYVCAGDHDPASTSFAIRQRPVVIGQGCWIAADVFIAPGIRIGDNSVVGARSSVFKSLPPSQICFGTPCVPIRPRQFD